MSASAEDSVDEIKSYTKTLQENGDWPDGMNVNAFERIASGVVGGGLLAASAYFHKSPLAILGGLLGSALLVRGIGGKCALYRALRLNTAHPALCDRAFQSEPDSHEARMDDTLDDSFPASDPPAWN